MRRKKEGKDEKTAVGREREGEGGKETENSSKLPLFAPLPSPPLSSPPLLLSTFCRLSAAGRSLLKVSPTLHTDSSLGSGISLEREKRSSFFLSPSLSVAAVEINRPHSFGSSPGILLLHAWREEREREEEEEERKWRSFGILLPSARRVN